jgi:succinyl-CoA synthetase alpha subunit
MCAIITGGKIDSKSKIAALVAAGIHVVRNLANKVKL